MMRWRVLVHCGPKFSVFTLVGVYQFIQFQLISVHITITKPLVLIEEGLLLSKQQYQRASLADVMAWGDMNVTNKNKQNKINHSPYI
jgi:hypothetical protein